MSKNRKLAAVLAAVVVLVIAGVVWGYFRNRVWVSRFDEADLVARLDSSDAEQQFRVMGELADRGDKSIPALNAAFEKASSMPAFRKVLVEATWRLPPTEASVAALKKMAKALEGTEEGPLAKSYAEDRESYFRSLRSPTGERP